MPQTDALPRFGWQTPAVILICGCLIGIIGFGPRSALGLFLTPMSSLHGWGREIFSLALAIQMLMWGAAQPFVGAIADRFGPVSVLCVGAILYAAGLGWMAFASSPLELHVTAGFIVGVGLAGTSFTVVIGAFAKLLPVQWRMIGFGAGTAAGSFGQFLFSPLAVALNSQVAWQTTLLIFAGIVMLIMPLSLALAFRGEQASGAARATQQSVTEALREALGHRSYVLLVLGFFTCGFQLFFITVHLPAFIVDRGLPVHVGAWAIAAVGLFNIVGSLLSGWLSDRMPKRYLLALIYALRSLAIAVYIVVPVTAFSSVVFGAVMGLLWLSTVPPTQGLVAVMFGVRWLTMLAGFAFFSHQVGGFLGVWLGGVLFERTGSYDVIWYFTILLGILSALVNLPIVEKPVARAAAAAA
jgi:MFS family permease